MPTYDTFVIVANDGSHLYPHKGTDNAHLIWTQNDTTKAISDLARCHDLDVKDFPYTPKLESEAGTDHVGTNKEVDDYIKSVTRDESWCLINKERTVIYHKNDTGAAVRFPSYEAAVQHVKDNPDVGNTDVIMTIHGIELLRMKTVADTIMNAMSPLITSVEQLMEMGLIKKDVKKNDVPEGGDGNTDS